MSDDGLFFVDSTGDAAVREDLARASSSDAAKHRKKKKAGAAQRRRQLLAQERELAASIFELPTAAPPDDEAFAVGGDESEAEEGEERADSSDDASDQQGGDDDDDDDEAEAEADAERDSDGDGGGGGGGTRGAAAWVDEDDEQQEIKVSGRGRGMNRLRKLRQSRSQQTLGGTEYVASLRRQFESVQPDVSWAELPAVEPAAKRARGRRRGGTSGSGGNDDDSGSEDADAGGAGEEDDAASALMRSSAPLLGRSTTLPVGVLSVRRLTDLNARERSASMTPCVQWHPDGKFALTAGADKTLRLFRTDGADNPKLQSVHFPKLPIASAAFTADGGEILVCGRSRQWGFFDLHAGSLHTMNGLVGRSDRAFNTILPSPAGDVIAMVAENGAVHLLAARSKALIASLQTANSAVSTKFATQAIAFSSDGTALFTTAEGGAVRVWDVRRRCCVHTWHDSGGLRVTALATSSNGQLLATGADSGAVNVYRTEDVLRSSRPSAVKEYLHLTSAVTTVNFHPECEMLTFASKYVKRAMRVAHVSARQVFSNWPTSKTPLNYVQCASFSPKAGYMAIGTDQGKVLLYQLNHYASTA